MYSVEDCVVLNLSTIKSFSGNITVLQNDNKAPFQVKRIYYLYDVPVGAERGGHSHYELEQLVVAASGSFTFIFQRGEFNGIKVF